MKMKRSSPSPETVAMKKAKAEVAEARRMQAEAMISASRMLNKRLGLTTEKPAKIFDVTEDKELASVEYSDVTEAIDNFIQKFPVVRHALTPIVLRSQIYSALNNERASVDSEIERLQRKNYLRVFSGVIQTSDRRRDFIVKTEDYVDDILTDSQQCIGTPAKEVLSEFAQFIRRYPKSSVSLETLLKYVKSPDAVKVLTEREWVEVNTGGSQVTFAIPRVARFVEMCVEGGEEIKRLVERKSTSFSRLPLSEALEYKMRFSILGPAFHIADLCGKGVVVK